MMSVSGQQQNNVARKSIVAAALGNALEWYDFSVYAFFASYIAGNFFAKGDAQQGLIATFVVFASGFIARPLGGVVLGMLGDRRGRKSAMLVSLFTMGISLAVIVFTPPEAAIGITAPVLLVIGRLLQGFSAGGEIGGAASFMIEHAPPGRRGLYTSWLQASMGISNLLAAIVGLVITSLLTDDQITQWAWRIPFIFGLLIIPVGLYIRKHLPETETFTQAVGNVDSPRRPLQTLLKEHWATLLAGFGFSVLWTVAVYAFVIFGPTYYKIASGLEFTSNQTFLASLVGNIVLIGGCVAFGRLADVVGRKRVLQVSASVMVLLPLLLLLFLHAVPSLGVLLLVHSLLCLNVSAFVGVAPATLPQAFPASVRSSGVSISYNLAAIGFAGFTPSILTWAIDTISVYSPAILIAGGALASLASIPILFRSIQRQEVSESTACSSELDLSS